MNINELSSSASTSKSQVTSKYFSTESGLDDSLKDFQEKKKNITGPKNGQKTTKKKPIKRIKGQKDIRSLIKKKNELISYSKDFDQICKRSGIDVDSEQLQLAIALSKSVQETQNNFEDETSRPLTSQERTNKIRTTLQEYGFKVPEAKIEVKKSVKRRKKSYKLLLATDAEKKQVVSDRYSQVLFENITASKGIFTDIPKDFLYYKTTGSPYTELQSDNVFYIDDLVEKSYSSINRLKNWSDIPGRCPSPQFEGPLIGFEDIQCSQEEVDLFLSGTIASCKDFLHKKLNSMALLDFKDHSQLRLEESNKSKTRDILVNETLSDSIHSSSLHSPHLSKSKENILINETLTQAEPDISSVTRPEVKEDLIIIDELKAHSENASKSLCVSEDIRSKSPDMFDDEVSSIVDDKSTALEKVSVENNYETIDLTQPLLGDVYSSNISEKINTSISVIQYDNVDDKIDLTQNYNDGDDTIEYNNDDFLKSITDNDVIICDYNENDSLNKTKEETKTSDLAIGLGMKEYDETENVDLTQSSDELPDVKISCKTQEYDTEEIVIINEDCNYPYKYTSVSKQNESNIENSFQNSIEYDNSHDSIKELDILVENNSGDKDHENIDLTQKSSNESLKLIHETLNLSHDQNSKETCSLEKDGDVSVDYDEMFHNIVANYSNNTKSSSKSDTKTQGSSNISNNEASTSFSENFEISDKEFNYSINKSINEESNTDIYNDMNNVSDELPSVHMGKVNNDLSKKETPKKQNKNYDVVKTPSNNEYLVKTVEVTPMQNFERMSSPERNQELEKYGLKPLKRKRAIQLLTYIYNQTHPIVEKTVESPSKRFKPNSPRKYTKSPKKTSSDKENIYIQTSETPVIKDLSCNEEELVFQKREKAKVHSCRVPLHIAFHNYVSCRQHLYEAILCYEPINIDVIHKDLVSLGYRYNPKDLLKFLDKKCITVKTADNNSRNRT